MIVHHYQGFLFKSMTPIMRGGVARIRTLLVSTGRAAYSTRSRLFCLPMKL